MKKIFIIPLLIAFVGTIAQEKKGHYNNNPFKQLKEEWATPNQYRAASGAPGAAYYQQKADYKMDITLDEQQDRIYGKETITYTNNSPDPLSYLWVQLDQNRRSPDSETKKIYSEKMPKGVMTADEFIEKYYQAQFDGGFNLQKVDDINGKPLKFAINQTMMRIHLPQPLKTGEKFSFKIEWWYHINNYLKERGRSGYEAFEDGNRLYVIAQFFPRMAVYNDVEGWQNMQFWGRSEFALPFGDYEVEITVPADHILNATGRLTNAKEVLNKKQYNLLQKAWKTYDQPTMIVSEEEARKAEKSRSSQTKTWKFKAENVRDFGFSTSRKFIWDAMAVKLGEKDVLAMSLYPKEGNPLWEKYSTLTVAHTLREYSEMTFDYPYHKAISVHAKSQGMEYPMICWNYGRPSPDGSYSNYLKRGMIGVIIHEIGHNYFPMIVNSDERQWTWMDEGLNTFLQHETEQNLYKVFPQDFKEGVPYPSRRGTPEDIVEYMSMDQAFLAPIMTQGDHVIDFGANAYGKPATGLVILRHTIMGKELFDYAFKTYAERWKFKHPTPEDFFRTMEDASAMDLDWFWRGWFYTTWYVDLGVKKVKPYYLHINENQNLVQLKSTKNEISSDVFNQIKEASSDSENQIQPRYFYEITYEKIGEMMMPLLVDFEFEDGSFQHIEYPTMIWNKNKTEIIKTYAFEKPLKAVYIDKEKKTADINTANNTISDIK